MVMGHYHPPSEPRLKLARMHYTLISLPASVRKLFSRITGVDTTKDKGGSGPMVDASDVQHLGLMLPYLFHRLATDEVEAYNKGKTAHDPSHQSDPSDAICEVFTCHLKWYFRFRRPQNSTRSLDKLQTAGKRYLDQLNLAMPVKSDKNVSVHNTVKVHFPNHAASLLAIIGDFQNASCSVTEEKHKTALKDKDKNTNQHAATFGLSLMKNNRRDQECRAMMQDIAGDILCSSIQFNAVQVL